MDTLAARLQQLEALAESVMVTLREKKALVDARLQFEKVGLPLFI